MRNVFWLPLFFGLAAGSLWAGEIQIQTTPLGGNTYHFTYNLVNISLQANQDIDFRFDPTLYGSLSNPVAPGGFITAVLQPDNPPGTFGDYYAFTSINMPSLTGTFSVDAVFLGTGTPAAQPYFINQFDAGGYFVSTVEAGVAGVPEPGTFALTGVMLMLGGLWIRTQRRA